MRRPRRSPPWVTAYGTDQDALLLSRVRLGSWVILPAVLGVTVCNAVAEPSTAWFRTSLAVPFLLLSVSGAIASSIHPFRGWGLAAGLCFFLLLIAAAAVTWRALPQDADLVPIYVCLLIMSSTLIFPWGMRPQAVVCAAALALYVWAMGGIGSRFQATVVMMVGSLVPVTLVAARVVESGRRTIFERAWQQEQLVSLARDLAQHIHPDAVLRTVLDHGVGLLGAQWAWVALYDPSARVFRFAALGGERVDSSWIGVEIPEEFSSVRTVVERGLAVLPEDAPNDPVAAMLRAQGALHALYVTLRQGGDQLGIVAFGRDTDQAFEAGERALAQGLADQASLALRTTRLIADLRHANQLKSEFVSTMSHELRTPLNVILGYASMAREGLLDEVPVAECLARIEGAGRDLLGLVESTLEIGRVEAHRDEVRLEPVALPTLWAELGAACTGLPRHAGVTLDWVTPAPAGTLTTDRRKLTIVVRNLVGNACKFTERGTVRASLVEEDGAVLLRVADTGIGIRREDQGAIFEMFRQADGSDSRRYGGAGLGLYIVRRFVGQLGASVAVESTPGSGSVFTVRIPGPVQRAAAVAAA